MSFAGVRLDSHRHCSNHTLETSGFTDVSVVDENDEYPWGSGRYGMKLFGRDVGSVETPAASGAIRYDAFISYSRQDTALVQKLHHALTRYRPPREVDGQRRFLRIFRDEGDLTGSDYYKAIDAHLKRSDSLIVVCSPAARASAFVDDEIRRFIRLRGADRIIPVIAAGVPNNEATSEAEKALPEALFESMTLPLANSTWVGFDPSRHKVDSRQFANSWYTLLANLYRIPRAQIEERDQRRRRRARRIAVSTTASVMAALVGLTLYSMTQSRIARENAEIATREARTAERVTAVLIDMFRSSDPAQTLGESITAREILNQGTTRVRNELREEPEVQARILGVLGQVYQRLGMYDDASGLIEEALAARRSLNGPESLEVAESMHDLAVVRFWQEHMQESEDLVRGALARRLAELGSDHLEVAASEELMGRLLGRRGAADSALALQRHALEVRRRHLPESDPLVLENLSYLAATLAYYVLDSVASPAAAQEALDAAIGAYGDLHPAVAQAWLVRSVVNYRLGDLDASGEALREVIAQREILLDPEHPEVLYAKTNLASVLGAMGDSAAAEALYAEIVPAAKRRLPPDHTGVIAPITAVGNYRLLAGDYSSAEARARDALERIPETERESPYGVSAQVLLGSALSGLGRFDEAEKWLLAAYATIESQRTESENGSRPRLSSVVPAGGIPDRRPRVLEELITLYDRQGRPESASQYRVALANIQRR